MNLEKQEIEVAMEDSQGADLLNVENESELRESSTEHLARPLFFHLIWILLVILVIISGFSFYQLYPLKQKIAGKWENEDQSMLVISKKDKWELVVPNYQGVKGFSLVYKGVWKTHISNQYEGEAVEMSVTIEKEKFPKAELTNLLKSNEEYKVIEDTSGYLKLSYTEKGLEKIVGQKSLEGLFHFVLEKEHFFSKEATLYLNSSYFSVERIPFKLKAN